MSKIMVRVIYSGLFLCYNFFTLCERIEIMTKKRIALKIVRRVGICILTTVVLLLIGLLGVVRIMEFGPSKTARNLFVNSAMESSAGGILVTLFFSSCVRIVVSDISEESVTSSVFCMELIYQKAG